MNAQKQFTAIYITKCLCCVLCATGMQLLIRICLYVWKPRIKCERYCLYSVRDSSLATISSHSLHSDRKWCCALLIVWLHGTRYLRIFHGIQIHFNDFQLIKLNKHISTKWIHANVWIICATVVFIRHMFSKLLCAMSWCCDAITSNRVCAVE